MALGQIVAYKRLWRENLIDGETQIPRSERNSQGARISGDRFTSLFEVKNCPTNGGKLTLLGLIALREVQPTVYQYQNAEYNRETEKGTIYTTGITDYYYMLMFHVKLIIFFTIRSYHLKNDLEG